MISAQEEDRCWKYRLGGNWYRMSVVEDKRVDNQREYSEVENNGVVVTKLVWWNTLDFHRVKVLGELQNYFWSQTCNESIKKRTDIESRKEKMRLLKV